MPLITLSGRMWVKMGGGEKLMKVDESGKDIAGQSATVLRASPKSSQIAHH